MSQAVYKLFPGVKSYIGPVIKDGFYYDFYFEKKFTETDLEKIEIEMKSIAAKTLLQKKKFFPKKIALIFSKKKMKNINQT